MVFDDEVEKMSGTSLHSRIQRLAAKGLIDGAQYAVELIATLRAKKIRRLISPRERFAQSRDDRSGIFEG